MILAIDTSTSQASFALVRHGRVLAEFSWEAGRNHSTQLLHLLNVAKVTSGIGWNDLSHIAVALGPGSFSGIRVGVSAAQGLALGLGIPVVGICTLDVIAFQASGPEGHVLAVIPAGRGEVYVAMYGGTGVTWHRREEPALKAIDRALLDVPAGTLVAGPGVDDLRAQVSASNNCVRWALPHDAVRRASYLAELARLHFDTSGGDHLHDLEPLYLRRSAAEEKRRAGEG